jgi:hypothetical protein
MLLEMADYDPLRAQEIEAGLTQEWWVRWMVDRTERTRKKPPKGKQHG